MQRPWSLPGTPDPDRAQFVTIGLLTVAALLVAACGTPAPTATPPISPGTSTSPREVNVIARDYTYVPATLDLVPGETVVLHVINAGLEIHEAVIGDVADQQAWEEAEASIADLPPGPTPLVPDPAGFDGVRVVVGSGQLVDVTWTVPADAAADAGGWFVGCHIPGHWAKGMVVPVRFPAAATGGSAGDARGGVVDGSSGGRLQAVRGSARDSQ